MKHIEMKRLVTGIIVLGILATIRVVFFAVDGTRNAGDAVLQIIVYVGSMGLLATLIAWKRDIVMTWIRNPGEKRWVIAFFLLMEISFLFKTRLMPSGLYVFSVLFSISLLMLLSLYLPKRVSKIMDITVMVILTLYILGQDIYYRIFNDFFSAREIVSAREGFESAESMFQFEIYQLVVLIIFAGMLFLYCRERQITHLRFQKRWFFLPLFLLVLIQFNSHYPKSPERMYTSEHYVYQSMYHKETFVKSFGVINYLFRDLTDSFVAPIEMPGDRPFLGTYYAGLTKTFDDHDLVGLFEGKNLIYILAESYDEIALSETLTPTLFRMKTEGIDFQSHFTPVYPRTTSDTEFIINTGQIPSIEDGPTSFMFRNNTYRTSMAYLFGQKGYQTQAFHANYKEFYGRHILYQGYGYDAFKGQHELGLSDVDKRFDTRFYQSMKSSLQMLDEPFMTMLITFSGHSPYTVSNAPSVAHLDQVDAYYGNTIPMEVKHYIATQIELDQMLEQLLSDLETWGILEETVIILSGDHYPYTMNQTHYEAMSSRSELHLKQQGNLYMWTPDIEPMEIDFLSSSFDVLPMIIRLFNLPGIAKEYVGTDILGGSGTLVYFKNYTVYNGSKLIQMYDRNEQDTLMLKQAYDAYRVSKMILRTNYFKLP
jgi:phosphoglycerol transferase MdoB-like AlkP superfamily enzyme